MAIALVAHGAQGSTDSNGFTSGSIDTTGANFLVVCLTSQVAGTGTISDSKSNTWTALTNQIGSFSDRWCRLFYSENPTVGSGHTFTVSGTNIFPTIGYAAFSGVATSSSFDVENGPGSTGYGTSTDTGSVTPGSTNELVIAGLNYDDNSTSTVDSGFTTIDTIARSGFGFSGIHFAYIVETSIVAKNPTFSWSNNDRAVAAIATFKAGGAGSSVGAAAGTGAAAAVGKSLAPSVGASAGVGAAAGVGKALSLGVGAAAGTGAASATGVAAFAGVGSASGVGAAAAVGTSTAASVGSSAGAGVATGVGASAAASIGASAGTGVAFGVGSSLAASVGNAAGTGTALGIAPGGSIGAATGAGAATGVGSALAAGIGSSAGIGAASAVGAALSNGVGSASGIGAASGVGVAAAIAVGTSAGTGAATAVGAALSLGVGSASGLGTALGVSTSTASVGNADGVGIALGIGAFTGSLIILDKPAFVTGDGYSRKKRKEVRAEVKAARHERKRAEERLAEIPPAPEIAEPPIPEEGGLSFAGMQYILRHREQLKNNEAAIALLLLLP